MSPEEIFLALEATCPQRAAFGSGFDEFATSMQEIRACADDASLQGRGCMLLFNHNHYYKRYHYKKTKS